MCHEQFGAEGGERAGSDDGAGDRTLASRQRHDRSALGIEIDGRPMTGLVESFCVGPVSVAARRSSVMTWWIQSIGLPSSSTLLQNR